MLWGALCRKLFGILATSGQGCETLVVWIYVKTHTPKCQMLAFTFIALMYIHIYCMHKQSHCQNSNSPCNCLSCVCLMDNYMFALPDTHTESNGADEKTYDSLYHCCFSFTLIQNRHTLRNTNRHTHNRPLIQNTSRTNRKRVQLPARNPRQNGLHGRWSESSSNRPNLILLPRWSHTHKLTKYMCAHKYGLSCLFNKLPKPVMAYYWVTCRETQFKVT